MSKLYNHDVAALCRTSRRTLNALYLSVSGATSGMNKFDQTRMKANVAATRSLLAWINSQPDLDLVESHPTEIEVPDPEKKPLVESDSINLAMDILFATEVELVNCVSAREAAGMNKFDSGRLTSYLTKLDSLIDNHVAVVEPQDFPESTPSQPLSGKGSLGT